MWYIVSKKCLPVFLGPQRRETEGTLLFITKIKQKEAQNVSIKQQEKDQGTHTKQGKMQ